MEGGRPGPFGVPSRCPGSRSPPLAGGRIRSGPAHGARRAEQALTYRGTSRSVAPAPFLVLRGPLGAGKTTIADAVARSIGGEVVSIDPILERWEWDGGSEALFLRANEVAATIARGRLEAGVPVVFDGNFYWRSAIDDLLERLPFPHAVFSLKAPIEVCIERDGRRPHSYGEAETRAVFAKVVSFEYGIPIDAARPVDALVRDIRTHLAAL